MTSQTEFFDFIGDKNILYCVFFGITFVLIVLKLRLQRNCKQWHQNNNSKLTNISHGGDFFPGKLFSNFEKSYLSQFSLYGQTVCTQLVLMITFKYGQKRFQILYRYIIWNVYFRGFARRIRQRAPYDVINCDVIT